MTQQRAAVLGVFRDHAGHLTAEEIYRLAKERFPRISRATVYNNLKALAEEGQIRRFSADEGADRYDRNPIPHGHLVCVRCGSVNDLCSERLDAVLAEELGGDVRSYDLIARGLCPLCRGEAR